MYMPHPMTMAMIAVTRGAVTCHGSLSLVGSIRTMTKEAPRLTRPTGMISRSLRRVANETSASVAGPATDPDTALITLRTVVTASG